MDMIHFAPLIAMIASTLLSAPAGGAFLEPTSKGHRTAQMGMTALARGMEALAEQDPDAGDCFPQGGSPLGRVTALVACAPEAVGEGARAATGVAATLGGLFALGVSGAMIVGEALPENVER